MHHIKEIGALLIMGLLFVQPAETTVIWTGGTKDGLAVCEDKRLTQRDEVGNIKNVDDDVQKLIYDSEYGFAAIAGNLRLESSSSIILGYRTQVYDVLSLVRSFFNGSRDIRKFYGQMAVDLEDSVISALKSGPLG